MSSSPGNMAASKLAWLSTGKPTTLPLQSMESCTLCSAVMPGFIQNSISGGPGSEGLEPTRITGYEQPIKIANKPTSSVACLISVLHSIKPPTPSMLQTAAPLTWQKVQTEQLLWHSMCCISYFVHH